MLIINGYLRQSPISPNPTTDEKAISCGKGCAGCPMNVSCSDEITQGSWGLTDKAKELLK